MLLRTSFFVTGADTDVGKTRVSAALLLTLRSRGLRAVGMKPVASGCFRENGALRNEDALLLQAHSAQKAPYDLVNPYAFETPVAPHLAAACLRRGLASSASALDEGLALGLNDASARPHPSGKIQEQPS
jgi:dethiobiotin synthetase